MTRKSRVLMWQVALLSWSLMATPAGSAGPSRHHPFASSLPRTSRSRLGIRTGLVSEVNIGAGRGSGGAQYHHRRSRSLNVLLHGEVKEIGNWTCTGGCTPPHPDEVDAIVKQEACMETVQLGSLQLQDDIDLQCIGMNLTCAELETNETWKNYKEVLYGDCNQDEDLLQAECTMACRLNRYPVKRCTYTFDRNNKYGMHGTSGMYGFHHCVLLKYCNNATQLEETNLICNITDTHDILFSSTETTTSAPSTTTTKLSAAASKALLTPTAAPSLIVQSAPAPADDGGGAVMGAVIGGSTVGLLAIIATVGYFKVCRKPKGPRAGLPSNNMFAGVVHEADGGGSGSTVVVGRPVDGEGGGDVEGAGKGESGGKGDKV